jgi:hypothetical protein
MMPTSFSFFPTRSIKICRIASSDGSSAAKSPAAEEEVAIKTQM